MTAPTLAERAAAKAAHTGQSHEPSAEDTARHLPALIGAVGQSPIDEPELGAAGDPDQVPVHIAWLRVMREVSHISKGGEGGQYNDKKGTQYNFRGIDRTVNAFGPACRKHGVMVIPIKVELLYRTSQSKGGATCRECTATVTWAIKGPQGDVLEEHPQTAGEALDYSDKATTKAQTVAERTLLLVLGLVPTDDPDPDASYIERGNESRPSAEAYLAEITNPMTSRDRMRQIYNELGAHRLMHEVVEHEGDRGELGALFTKVANERWPRPDKPVHRHESEFEPDCPACQAEQAEADRAVSS